MKIGNYSAVYISNFSENTETWLILDVYGYSCCKRASIRKMYSEYSPNALKYGWAAILIHLNWDTLYIYYILTTTYKEQIIL